MRVNEVTVSDIVKRQTMPRTVGCLVVAQLLERQTEPQQPTTYVMLLRCNTAITGKHSVTRGSTGSRQSDGQRHCDATNVVRATRTLHERFLWDCGDKQCQSMRPDT